MVSLLENKGEPSIVQRTLIRPPCSRLGSVTDQARKALIEKSPIYGKYEDRIERESASEVLKKRAEEAAAAAAKAEAKDQQEAEKAESGGGGWLGGIFGGGGGKRRSRRQSVGEAFTKSLMRSIASSLGRTLMKVIPGRRR